MFKNKIFKYFFIEFIKFFLIISLSLSFLVWITQAARLLELITEYGNPVHIYIKFLILSYPKIFNNIFLLSFVISMFFLLNKMQNDKELNIYWMAGISKLKIIQFSILITSTLLVFYLIFSTFIVPWSSSKGRQILGNSKFSQINSLVKAKNFNSPLKGLTVYVETNDNKGNLEGIFIYEKERTIIASKGEVLFDGDKNFLKLYDGSTQEIINNSINIINFKTTIFDFTKFQMQNVSYPKFTEREINWLFKNINNPEFEKINRGKEIREEINSRLIKPFFIIILCITSCFLLYSNNEKINLAKFKFFIYSYTAFLIILNQTILEMSGKTLTHSFLYIIFIFILGVFSFLIINKTIKSETK